MESRCGILCGKCDWQKTEKCKGCTNIDNPFWGVCPVKSCCEEKTLQHCGECKEFPCTRLNEFAYAEKEGDCGVRLDQCKIWSALTQMRFEYRKLSEKDLNTFIEMRINQLREEGAKEDIDLKPTLLDYYTRHMKDGTFVSWIAVDNGKIIGTSGMSFVEKPPYFGCPSGRIGLLSSMFTNPNYRRRGIAKELLNRVVDEARDYGCGTIQITASDMGVKLYTAYGFVHNGNFMQYKL